MNTSTTSSAIEYRRTSTKTKYSTFFKKIDFFAGNVMR